MKLSKIVQVLEEIAPPEIADDFDRGRIGLILGLKDEVSKIAVALDANSCVLQKAAEIGADMLITHHTLIFHPVNVISKTLAASLKIALENEISLYSMHTNYDRAEGGINDVLAASLGLKNITTLELGRIGEIETCSTSNWQPMFRIACRLLSCTPGIGRRSAGLWLLEEAVSGKNFSK